MKNSRFQLERDDGKRRLIDVDEDNAPLTAAQLERLGRFCIAEAKQMKRAHQLRRLIPMRLLSGK